MRRLCGSSRPPKGPGSPDVYATSNSTELARDVVEKRHAHQENEQGYADLLAEDLRPLRKRTALEPLDGLKDDLPAVENGNGQHVQEPQRQRDDDQVLQE